MTQIDLNSLTADQLEELLQKKRAEERNTSIKKREAYEGIRADVVARIAGKTKEVVYDVKCPFQFVQDEATAFYEVMKEYGQLRREGQMSFKIESGNFRLEVKSNKVKKFDERADLAAARLIDFLTAWIKDSEKGTNNPMYQLAMTLLERNNEGDLDYKSVSKLYDLETDFNSTEYSEIMQLFKESNVIEGNAINYYFYEKNARGVWLKLEPSFNRL
jgi:hypothetical protein